MMTSNGVLYSEEDGESCEFGCYEDTARNVEIVREENKDGQLGSFGFTLVQERPPRIGIVIPGGPADKAGLKKGDVVLAVNSEDITKISHREVTNIIKNTKTQSVWLSVCESDEPLSLNSTLGSSPRKGFFQSTPAILTDSSPTSSMKRLHQLQNNGSAEIMPRSRVSPTGRKTNVAAAEPNYVVLMPPQSYTVTRMATLLSYCGPVKIPESWSNRGVSSLCIQECARQLLSKRKADEFLKVQLEVSQSSLRISNMSGNILVKHRRKELYYCGSCTNDEQYFGLVSKSDGESGTSPVADLCHVFKLLPDSKLSTYVIDQSKSQREIRSGPASPIKSCVEITETIQNIFQNDSQSKHKMELTSSGDSLEYGIVKGISTLQLASNPSNGSNESLGQPSPLLKRKKSNVVDLRTRKGSPPIGGRPGHNRTRSISNPTDPSTLQQRILHTTNSAGHISPNGGDAVHYRQYSDGVVGVTPVRGRSNLLHSSLPREDAKRISDCSFSSLSSDHSGHRSSTSRSGSPGSSPNKSQSPTPVPPPVVSPQRTRQLRKFSNHAIRDGAVSPCDTSIYGSKLQLRRQGSEGSVYDLTATLQMSPYHHLGLPGKNSGLSSSVDSIVTITTLAEDDVDLVVGRVAGWCGSFDRLLSDPLGLQCFLQFLEQQHGEENLLFWKDVEEYKKMPLPSLPNAAKKIYGEYMSPSAPLSINVDDVVVKNVESAMDMPTALLFDGAQKEIYQLMKLDCYPRFQKSPIIKESLLAEMEGRPLPIETSSTKQSASQVTHPPIPQWGKKKLTLLERIKNISTRDHGISSLTKPPPIDSTPPPPPPPTPPSTSASPHPTSSISFSSFSSITQTISKGGERRRSKKEKKELKKQKSLTSESSGYHPEDNLKHLQAHKGNLFEVNLPNRITKIIEAPPKATVREALAHVLKKYNYSLDVFEVKLTSTLQTVNIDSPAAVLIGKHVSIMKSRHTLIATFPDLPELILPADGTRTLRQVFDVALMEKGKTEPYSAYIDGARAPLELDMSSSCVEGHTVTVKYLSATEKHAVSPTVSIPDSSSVKEDFGALDELFSKIARLSSDTLSDQRIQQGEGEATKRSPKFQKKYKKGGSPKESLPKFARTKSGATISQTKTIPTPPSRSFSPPPSLASSLPPRSYYPPPPASDPPNLSHSTLNKPYNSHYGQWEYNHPSFHQHQRSGDAMSGISMGSGSSVDSITHELAADRKAANRMQFNQWIMQSQTSMSSYGGPTYFPAALGSMDTLERSHPGAMQSSSLSRKNAAMMSSYLNKGQPSDAESYNQRPPYYQQPPRETLGVSGGNPNVPGSSYPWRSAHSHQRVKPKLSSDQGSVISEDGQHFSDTSSVVSSTSSARGFSTQRQPLSPTTHVLVVEEQQSSESYV